MRIAMLVLNDMRADARVDREATALAADGHEVVVVSLRADGLPDSEERAGFTIRRVGEYTRSSWRRPLRKIAESRARREAMAAEVVRLGPTAVHCHDADTLGAGLAARAALGRARPLLVYDAHELYVDMVAAKGRSLPVQVYWRRIERRAVRCADLLLTVSRGLAEVLEARHGRPFQVIRNVSAIEPLESTGLLRQELGLEKDVPVVLYQGALIGGRGLDGLVRAMAHVPTAHLVVQGSGPMEDVLEREVLASELSGRVHLMGHMPPESLHSYACDADVGVVIYEHTSLNNYLAAPNKVFAYLMAGLPIVASDFPGLAEIIDGEGVGSLFDPADETSIASAIAGILQDDLGRSEMGERARRAAEGRYNWESESVRLCAMYADLARSKGAEAR